MQVFSSEYLKIKMQNTLYMVLYSIYYILHKCKYILNCVICIFSCLKAIKVFRLKLNNLVKAGQFEGAIDRTINIRWTIHSNVTPKVPSIGSKLTDQYLLLFRHQFVAKLGIRGGQVSGTRQNPPTFDRNPWRRPTPESCKSKIEIMTTKKRLRLVRELSLCWREPDLWCWC